MSFQGLPRIKICGITRQEDAELAASLGAWAIGFVFYAKSPRRVVLPHVMSFVKSVSLQFPEVKRVGVFVDEDLDEICRIVDAAGLTHVQLHGVETSEYCSSLAALVPGLGLIKALRPQTPNDLKIISSFTGSCEAILLDAHVPSALGGTGVTSDWTLARSARAQAQVVLAGGLNPENIVRAYRQVEPFAVDVCSGVEQTTGRKSAEKLNLFFEKAAGLGRTADA